MKIPYTKIKIPITWLIIGVLAVLLILQRSCVKCPELSAISDTITITKYDTTKITITKDKPVPYPVIVPPDTFRKYIIDSSWCKWMAKEYYTQRYYNNTFKNDTDALIKVSGLVYQNNLNDVKLVFVNRRATIVTTIINTPTIKKGVKVFVGATVGRSINEFTLCPSLGLMDRKDHLYSLTYDPFFKDWYGTFFYKIKLKK